MNSKICLLFTFCLFLLMSCSTDNDDELNNSLLGVWKLTAWNVENEFDINDDGAKNINLLNEIDCPNEETLVFDMFSNVMSNATFNPNLDIALINETSMDYSFRVECLEGIIGWASSYTLRDSIITLNEQMATLNGDQIIIIYEDAIQIYNEDFTQVIANTDLIKVYTKI